MSLEASQSIKSALIIDDDELVRNLIKNYIKVLGVERIDVAACGEEGWNALQNHVYDFIVLDWKLPKLAGMAILNRIRNKEAYRLTPILVVSGYVERFDFRLLQEFPTTSLMEKPFTKALFDRSVEKLVAEQDWYQKNEKNIVALMKALKYEEKKTFSLVRDMIKKAPNPIPLGMIAGCHMAMAGELRTAEKIFTAILSHDADCIVAMNELAKVHHARGQHKKALDLLQNAHRISPQNIKRLCLLGEVELNLKDPESARSYFEKALDIDAEDPVAKSGIVISDNMAEMIDSPEMDRVPRSFASMLNNMGIAFVRSGEYQRGIEQYRSAFAFLRTDMDSARLAFNLGLGYMRWGKPEKALSWFERSEHLGDGRFTRSRTFVRQLKTARKTKDVVVVNSAEARIADTSEADISETTLFHNDSDVTQADTFSNEAADGSKGRSVKNKESTGQVEFRPRASDPDGFFEDEDDEGSETITI